MNRDQRSEKSKLDAPQILTQWGRPTKAPCPIHATSFCRMGGKPRTPARLLYEEPILKLPMSVSHKNTEAQ